jgi:hypothetical protein
MRITVACPEGMVSDANNLAMVLAHGPDDGRTYGEPSWLDAHGNLYACASFPVGEEWLGAAQMQLIRPTWDTDESIDMSAAQRAQMALLFTQQAASEEGATPDPVLANPDTLLAVAGGDPHAVLKGTGLTQVQTIIA